MKTIKFINEAKKHHAKNNKSGEVGCYRGRSGYAHILPIDSDTKEAKWEAIKKYGLLDIVKQYAENYKNFYNHLHPSAHHLTSSQIMCYNFFRPLIEDPQKLATLFHSLGATYIQDPKCKFEYVRNKIEQTNYDFYIGNKNAQIYCEIKYTEACFGKECRASIESWKDRQENLYPSLVRNTLMLWNDEVKKDIPNFVDICMKNYYQLFRNALSTKGDNDYVFFICPQESENLQKSYTDFVTKYMSDYGKKHVQFVTWEDLIKHARKEFTDKKDFFDAFEDRYFAFLLNREI
jgi:hypothetical protein